MSTRVRGLTSSVAIALLLACAPLLTGHGGLGAQAPADVSLEPRVEDVSSFIWQGSFRLSDQVFGSDISCGGTSCATFAYGGSSLAFRHKDRKSVV